MSGIRNNIRQVPAMKLCEKFAKSTHACLLNLFDTHQKTNLTCTSYFRKSNAYFYHDFQKINLSRLPKNVGYT